MFIHPTVLRHLFVIKAVYTAIALFGVLGWVISANGGAIGDFKYTTKRAQLSGSDLTWPMIQAINSVMGALAPVLINQPDIARYGHSYGDATWSQGIGILLSKVMVMFLSTSTTAAATHVLGKITGMSGTCTPPFLISTGVLLHALEWCSHLLG